MVIISGKKCRIYKRDGEIYHRLAHGPESIEEVINDAPTRVANFTDPGMRRQATINKFLNRIDKWLDTIIGTSTTPVFLLAPEKVAGHFKKMTKHRKSIVGYIHGNFDDVTETQLTQLMIPYANRLIFMKSKSPRLI